MRGAMQHCPLCVMGAGRIVCDNDLSKLFNFHKLWVELPLDGHCRQLFFSLNMRIFLCAFQIMFYLCNRNTISNSTMSAIKTFCLSMASLVTACLCQAQQVTVAYD